MHFPRDGDIGPFYLDQQGFQSVSQLRNEWKLGKSIRHLDTCPVYEAISKVWLRCGSSWGGEVLTVFLKTTTYLKNLDCISTIWFQSEEKKTSGAPKVLKFRVRWPSLLVAAAAEMGV